MSLKLWSYSVLFRIFYYTGLRTLWNRFWQRIYDDKYPRTILPYFETPEAIWGFLKDKFQYRTDPLNGLIDYHSEPEVLYTRILDLSIKDEDCDGLAFLFATLVNKIPGVSDVIILNSGFKTGGHSTCVYKYLGSWFLFNYGIYPLASPNDAPEKVAQYFTPFDQKPTVTWWVWETLQMKPIAIFPKKLAI